jgi:hypothetical protein
MCGKSDDTVEALAISVDQDIKVLLDTGYAVQWDLRRETLYRAVISQGEDFLRLDWVIDSVFRFFPVQPDLEFGYCLHPADLGINKILALTGRDEPRDYLDTLQLDRDYLSLGALIWAACGKDQGYTPDMILQFTGRHSRYREDDFAGEHLAHPVDLRALKNHWLEARERARKLFDQLPAEELGCLYIDETGKPVTPIPSSSEFPRLVRHFGSIRGAWPQVHPSQTRPIRSEG